MPNPGQPVAEKGGAIDREWFAWLRRLLDALGFTPSVPVYADLPVTVTDTSNMSTATSVGGVGHPTFVDGSTTSMRFAAVLPNNYLNGTAIKLAALWSPTDGTAGNVVLRIRYSAAGGGETLPASTDQDKTVAAPAVDDRLTLTEWTDIPGSGLEKGDLILGVLQRVGADAADTYAAPVFGFPLLKYQIDGSGWEVAHP